MLGVVVQIDGFDPVAGQSVTLRAASHDVAEVCHLGGALFWPTIAKLPKLRYDFFDGAFETQISAPSSALTLGIEPWPLFGRYALADARFRLWTGEVGAPWAGWTQRFDGRVTQQPTIADARAELAVAVDDRWLDKALLSPYAGTGGAEGPAALKGQVKPLALGAPRYVAGVLVDAVNSVFQLSAYGSIAGVSAALERLLRYGPSLGDYPTFDALVVAAIPAGRWATCRAVGLVRLGAPPMGQISFLVDGDNGGPDGWARTPGQLIRRIARLAGGEGRIDDASLDALDAARPYPTSVYLDQQTTAREVIQQIAASVNAVAGMSWLGKLFVAPVAIGAPALTLAADGTALPPVRKVSQLEIAPPFAKLGLSAERAWTVHQLADIAFTATLTDLGTYAAGTTYREGNIVQAGGSSWLYINPAASAGNAPPAPPAEQNSYWKVLAKAGAKGDPGTSPLVGYLTNEAHNVAADAAGNPVTYAGASGQFRVLLGTTDVTSSCTFSLISDSIITAVINSEGYYGLTGFPTGSSQGYAVFRATYPGHPPIDLTFSVTKNNAGSAGAPAVDIQLTASADYVKYSDADVIASGPITFTAIRKNTELVTFFRFEKLDGDGYAESTAADLVAYDPSIFSSTGPDNLTITQAWANAVVTQGGGGFRTIVYVQGGPRDSKTLRKVKDGARGEDGKSALVGYLTNEAHNVAADAAGNPVTYAGASGQFRVLLGGADVTSGCTFSLLTDSIITAVINSEGNYGLTGFPAGSSSGYAVFRATYPGFPPIDLTFSVTKNNAGANGAPAVDIQLAASADVVKYSKSDVIASGTITFTTTRKNTSLEPFFRFEKLNGEGYIETTAADLAAYDPSVFSSTGPDNVTITQAWADAAVGQGGGGFRVIAYVQGGPRDRKTLLKVKDGTDGQDGVPGYNNANPAIYQRASSAPPLPTTTATYTFATASLTNVNNGWYTNGIPDGTDPVWVSSATASSRGATDTIAPGEWATPVRAFANGAAGGSGLNSKSIFIYQRASAAPGAPSATATYTFSSATLSGLNNGWSTTIPDGTGIVWVTTASALSASDTDSIAPGEWAAVAKLAQDGAAGVSPLLVTAQPAALQLQGDTAGAAVPGSLPAYIENSASRAGVAAAITGVTIDAATGCTASVAGDGTSIAITAISTATASVTYTVAAAGLSQQVKVGITVLRAPTSLEERGLNISSGGTSTSYDVFGGVISIQAGSSGKIDTLLSGTYYSGGSGAIGETRLQTKHQYRVPSGSWVDVSGSEGMGSSATRANGGPGEPPENNPGSPYGAVGHITGLNPGTFYEVRALAYYDTSAGTNSKPATGVGCTLIAKQVA